MSIKTWLQRIAGSFQPAYDQIAAWDLPPAVKDTLDAVWPLLGASIQKSLFEFVKKVYNDYGPDAGKKLLDSLLKAIKKFVEDIG